MADDPKKDIKGNNTNSDNTDHATKSNNEAVAKDNTVTSVITPNPVESKPVTATQANKGGEQAMAKDPTGMFDYSGCQTYTVKDGDKLLDIAQKYGVILQQLRYFNHLDKATFKIRKNQTIYIPNKPVYVPAGK